ncbi:MAG: hypothetical protein AAGE13_15155 [Pseudomonadota bacterium]
MVDLAWTDSQAIELSTRPAETQIEAYYAAVRKTGWQAYVQHAWLVALCAVVGVGTALTLLPDNRPGQWLFLLGSFFGALYAALAFLAFTSLAARQARRRAMRAPLRMGARDMRLDETGITHSGPQTHVWIAWSTILDVCDAEPGTALKLSNIDVVAIPDMALPHGIDRAELQRRIEIWRDAAAA